MIEYRELGKQNQIILTPNKSMTWETNKKILICMFAVSMIIAAGFVSIGAWVVLPFAGLEITLVGLAMYYVCWKLNFKHVITIEAESFLLQKGIYFPKQEWQWQLTQVQLIKRPSNYRMSAPTLFLKHLNEVVEIGDFLNLKEKKQLQACLQKYHIPIKTIK